MPTRRMLLRGGSAAALAMTVGAVTASPAAAAPSPAPVKPAEPVGAPDRDALQTALDQVVATGATAALARFEGPSGVWRGASGVVELGKTRPAPAHGRFRAGSITKTFVASVVLQMVGEQRLGLDDTVEQWLPGVLPNGAQITLRNLLQHTSGVFNYTDILFASLEYFLSIRFTSFTPRELVALAAGQPSLFEPGTSWSYSNTNYILLGLIVERVTGNRYADEVSRRILRPLGLHDTELPGTEVGIDGPHAHGYLPMEQDGQIVPLDITRLNPSAAWAAGEVISTTADLNRFYRALLRGTLLGPAQLRDMLTPTGPVEYGLGILRVVLPDGTTLWGHDGGIPGYASFSMSTEDARRQLTVSVNPWLGDFGPAFIDLVLVAFGMPSPAALSTVPPLRIPMLDRLPHLVS